MNLQQHKDWLQEQATALEKERQSLSMKQANFKRLQTLSGVLKVVCYLVGIVAAVLMLFLPPIGFIIALAVVALFYLIEQIEAKKSPQMQFVDTLKTNVVPSIFQAVNPNLTYTASGFNALAVEKSGLLNQQVFSKTVQVAGEDHVTGIIKTSTSEVSVEFTELKFFKKEVNYGKFSLGCLANIVLIPAQLLHQLVSGNSHGVHDVANIGYTDVNQFYAGMFLYADFPQPVTGELFMVPKSQASLTDKLLKTMVPKHLQQVSVANPMIEKNYHIHASDMQIVQQVLSDYLLNNIEHHAKTESTLPILSFRVNKLFMLIPWSKDYFDADLNKPITDASYFASFFEQVASFERIVNDFAAHT